MFQEPFSAFVGSVWSVVVFIPTTTGNDLQLQKDSYLRSHPSLFLSYLSSSERASISLFNV